MKILDVTQTCKNHSARGGAVVRTIVLHHTAGKATGSLAWFADEQSKVSAHYLINRAGFVYLVVPEHRAAWATGNAQTNKESINIELEAWEPKQGLSDKQDHALITLLDQLMDRYNLTPDRITLHRFLKKTECGKFIFAEDKDFNDYIRNHF